MDSARTLIPRACVESGHVIGAGVVRVFNLVIVGRLADAGRSAKTGFQGGVPLTGI